MLGRNGKGMGIKTLEIWEEKKIVTGFECCWGGDYINFVS